MTSHDQLKTILITVFRYGTQILLSCCDEITNEVMAFLSLRHMWLLRFHSVMTRHLWGTILTAKDLRELKADPVCSTRSGFTHPVCAHTQEDRIMMSWATRGMCYYISQRWLKLLTLTFVSMNLVGANSDW